jgi:hypothetical protein
MDNDQHLCCPECGSDELREVPATTTWGRDYVLVCDNDDCLWVGPDNTAMTR